ncbi:MAG TPA: gliding motility-associated C-terminal domain-containing protein, partial [Chitinophagaceae bacterium]|nr:gliding motility-associated C-terminal domain-containing protein [Chitinophagaceae bacterium]
STVLNPNPAVAVILTGTAGGIYSITPASGLPINAMSGEINPSGAAAGTYTIKYTIPGSGGCSNFITTATVTVSGAPTATITYPVAVCSSAPSANVQLTGTQGGAFTSTAGLSINSATGVITPATSMPGTYVVTYTIAPSAPCPGFVTTAGITITAAPSASIAYNSTNLCNVTDNAATPNPAVAVILTGLSGGVYSVTPATGLTIDAVTGMLTPSGATAGTYTIKYTLAGGGGCPNFTTTTTVIVSGAPTAAISYTSPVCSSAPSASIKLSGTQGGIFTSTAGLTINATTGTVTPVTSTPGSYIITYTIAASAPCPGFVTTAAITITQAPSASIVYDPVSLCNVANTVLTPNPPVSVTQTGSAGGSYSIVPATGLPVNAATGTITPSGAITGQYTIKYSIAGAGGCADYNTTTVVTVSAAPVAAIIYSGSPFCRGINIPQHVSFTGTTGGVFSAGQGLSVNAATGDINPSLSTPGIYTVTYTIAANAPCPGYVTNTAVQIDDSPVLTFPVAAQSICSGSTALFSPSSTVSNTIYSWSVTGALPANVSGISAGALSGPNPVIALSFTNTGASSQTITVQVKPTNASQNPCPGTPYNLTLTINPIPAAISADTFRFCMGVPPATLSVNPLPGNSIKWYDKNFVLLNTAPVINTAVPVQFAYYISQTNSYGCESPKSGITAIVNPTAKIISASYTNPTTCGIPSGSIVLNVLDINNNPIPNIPLLVHYNKFQTAYQVLDSTDAQGKITVSLVAGTYSGIYVETFGCASQKIPDVFILKDPSPPAPPVAGYNPPLCSETLLNLTAITPTSNQAGPIDYVWTGPAFGPFADTVRNTFIAFPSASVSDAGTYVVYAIQNNCISATTSFQVVIKQSPSKPRISTRVPLCVGDDLVLQAYSSIQGPDAVLNYVWRGPGTGFPVNAPNAGIAKVKIQDAGIYSITVSSPQTGCSTTSDTLVLIGGYPVVKFAQDSLTLPTGYLLKPAPIIINAADPGILPMKRFEWTPFQDIVCNDSVCSSPVATIKNNICYTVKATNMYGCSGSASICIKVLCQSAQIFIPNAFTPRGDVPENAKLIVRASGIASVKSFRVFNRWGRIVFERNNFPPNSAGFGWDGRVNGKLADPGVYIYTADVICENGIPYSFKGNVTLL